jgi:hypothetical protein
MKENFRGNPEHLKNTPPQPEGFKSTFFRPEQARKAPPTPEGEAYRERLEEVRKNLREEYKGKTKQEREEIFEKLAGNPVATFLSVREKLKGDVPLEKEDIYHMKHMQAFGERFQASWNLKVLEMKINYLAGKGDARTQAEEEELNRCIVWYSINKKLHAEADIRMSITFQKYINAPRSKQLGNPASPQNIPAALIETQKQTDQAA